VPDSESSPRRPVRLRMLALLQRLWRDHAGKIVAGAAWTYPLLLAGFWLILYVGGDRWWLPTVMLFGPRWIVGLPLLIFIPAAFYRRRLVWPGLIAVAILLGPVMGFCIPWGRFATGGECPLRVLSCNVHITHFDSDKLSALIRDVRPDIVALQECGKAVPCDWPAGWYVYRDWQLVVASRYPIRDGRTAFGRRSLHNRLRMRLLHCIVEVPGRDVDFCTVHLLSPSYGLSQLLDRRTLIRPSRSVFLKRAIAYRRRGSVEAQQYVSTLRRPLILAGDFNMPVDSSIYRQVWAEYSNAFSLSGFGFGYTMWPTVHGAQFTRIDHVLSGPGWRPRRCWVGPDVGSDHRPLIADLCWEGSADEVPAADQGVGAEQVRESDNGQGRHAAVPHDRPTESHFTAIPADPFRPPRFVPIEVPRVPGDPSSGDGAIRGATGCDSRGHVWFGVSTPAVADASAHLFEYVPDNGEVIDRGDVLSELKRCGLYRPDQRQGVIPSRIVPDSDGNLYFSSTDQQGEDEHERPSAAGRSHLWRLRLPENRWEHLLAAPEGLVAVAGAGDWIYSLGRPGRVMYQYDVKSGEVNSVVVGGANDHASHTFICDHRGHVYVPRLSRVDDSGDELSVALVEFDASLQEVAETVLRHYRPKTPATADDRLVPPRLEGIVARQYLADRSVAFVTQAGFLYRIVPRGDGAADVTGLGWFHPDGEADVASLFTFAGQRYLLGASNKNGRCEWLVFDLSTNGSQAVQIPKSEPVHRALRVFGCVTRDNDGNFYLTGALPETRIEVTEDLERTLRAIGARDDELAALRRHDDSRHSIRPVLFRVQPF